MSRPPLFSLVRLLSAPSGPCASCIAAALRPQPTPPPNRMGPPALDDTGPTQHKDHGEWSPLPVSLWSGTTPALAQDAPAGTCEHLLLLVILSQRRHPGARLTPWSARWRARRRSLCACAPAAHRHPNPPREQANRAHAPDQAVVGADAVWVTSSEDDTVMRVDAASGKVETIPVGNRPTGIAFDEDRVWVANSQDGTISRIDTETYEVGTLHLGFRPTAVAVEQGAVWVALAA
jgi:YVTN family beta-propeller protein